MIFGLLFLFFTVAVNGQDYIHARDYRYNPYYDESPKPYSFSYNAPLEDGVGQSSRTETADGSGTVQGSYTVTNDEGHTRIVDYIADHAGFRATIRTNEPGTDNKNPADVIIESAGPFAYRPFQYTQRRPGATAVVDPVAPVQPVEVMPENVIQPVSPSAYSIPPVYNRNYQYRPRGRYPPVRY